MTFAITPLLQPSFYDHPVTNPQLVETHISWVILTGDYAYKIKKSLDLGFLDFSTLERRRRFCEEELRLNRRLAPKIYLEVIPIYGTPDAPRLRGEGPAIEYAIKMRQFPQEGLLDRRIREERLDSDQVDTIARLAGEFHGRIAVAPTDSEFGTPDSVHFPVAQNFEQTLAMVSAAETRTRLEELQDWSERTFESCRALMGERKAQGFTLECHGDMHLGNMADVDGEVVIFDGIEFNDNLRWIDVMSEIAFLFMDLQHRGRLDYAWRALNRYLEVTGDYAGLNLLRYYQGYRTMVRAKVARIRFSQPGLDETEQGEINAEFEGYLRLAEGYMEGGRPMLILMRGVSGSGKTVISQGLLEALGAVRIRSDVERKRLYSLAAEENSGSELDSGIYTREASRHTFDRLLEQTGAVLQAGYPVIVDATFLERSVREPFRKLAAEFKLPFYILNIDTDAETLRERVQQRSAEGKDASEAGLEVLEKQLASYGPLETDESPAAIPVNGNSGMADIPAIINSLAKG
ncbi:MAG: AAA family ATPase [Gammaproteobacteria bacterium]|nr:AAA family ATPase [Gammaproteobacteria bacterium]